VGALTRVGVRRVHMIPKASHPRPKLVRGPDHGRAPENRHTGTQFKKINDFPTHNLHTSGTQRGPIAHARACGMTDCVLTGGSDTGRLATVRGQSRPCRYQRLGSGRAFMALFVTCREPTCCEPVLLASRKYKRTRNFSWQEQSPAGQKTTGPLALPSPSAQVHDLPLHRLAGHQRHEMRAPALERTAAFFEIIRPVVAASNAGLVSAGMTEDDLDHVRRDAE